MYELGKNVLEVEEKSFLASWRGVGTTIINLHGRSWYNFMWKVRLDKDLIN